MKRTEFISQLRERERKSRWIVFFGFMLMGFLFLGVAATDFLNESGRVTPAAAILIQKILCGLSMAGLVALLVAAWSGGGRGVPCPQCRKMLFGVSAQIVVATRVCGYCGEKILD